MNLTLRIGVPEIRAALELAEKIGVPELSRQLNAPVDAALIGRIDEAWQHIKEAVSVTVRKGKEATLHATEQLWEKMDAMLRAAGTKARLLEDALCERVRTFQFGLNKALLDQIVGSVSAGGVVLTLSSVQMTQAIKLQGSLKASLSELLMLASEGSLEIVASYRRVDTEGRSKVSTGVLKDD